MIDVKLIVLVVCISTISARYNYCEICSQHILCKYTMPGPASSCKRYDKSVHLTEDDINDIVNRLNERRNFVAMGYSKLLPQAANMKKMMWSEELATFAQRWVDQCVQSSQPNKEDQCRDLRNTEVGQNIASISGATSLFNVKSFIDIWIMQTIDYSGSVSYYNQTRDHKSNYFSQLIWAETSLVGCGRARFYVSPADTMIDRLVCNFAPKGNIHGRPVYAIGYPATQCSIQMRPDDTFEGLCRHKGNVRKFTSPKPRVSSLLRILNLSNGSVKQDIDPIRNNLKQIKTDAKETIQQRNQKTRHILYNMHAGRVKYRQPLHPPNVWNHAQNISKNLDLKPYRQDRGHSRVYHSHDFPINEHTQASNQESAEDSVMRYQNGKCTRRPVGQDTPHDYAPYVNSKCTRGNQKNDYVQTTPSPSVTTSICREQMCDKFYNDHIYPHDLCPCTTPRPITRCMCNINCQCLNYQMTSIYQDLLRNQFDKIEKRKSSEIQYYGFPNVGVRSGETFIKNNNTLEKQLYFSNLNSHISDNTSGVYREKDTIDRNNNRRSIKNNYDNNRDYSFQSSTFSERKRRDLSDQITFKPFWQMEEFTHKKPSLLKSLRYTTLPSKKNKLTKKMPTTVKTLSTESITVKKAESHIINSVKEKYLSFDELMHLRKLGISEIDTDARRQANEALRNSESTKVEVTANTPFIRKKHCTRKVTCTWTASSPTGADGSIIPGGGGQGGDIGSRTPPGYVDGCTRTSTCTRDYMDRNKGVSSDEESSGEVTLEDEDYCERRALNVRLRKSGEHHTVNYVKLCSKSYPDAAMTTFYPNFISGEIQYSSTYQYYMTTTPHTDCMCYDENDRIKRNDQNYNNQMLLRSHRGNINENQSQGGLSYGDLYYLVLHKVIKAWKSNRSQRDINKCMCNTGVDLSGCIMLIFSFIIYILI